MTDPNADGTPERSSRVMARRIAKGLRVIGAICTFVVGAQLLDRLFPHCPPDRWDWGCVFAGVLALLVLFVAIAVTWDPDARAKR